MYIDRHTIGAVFQYQHIASPYRTASAATEAAPGNLEDSVGMDKGIAMRISFAEHKICVASPFLVKELLTE